jgi:hypothetical protein
VLGMMRRLRVQRLDSHRRWVLGCVGMPVVLGVVQCILLLAVPVMTRKAPDVLGGVGFMVVRCRFSCESW